VHRRGENSIESHPTSRKLCEMRVGFRPMKDQLSLTLLKLSQTRMSF